MIPMAPSTLVVTGDDSSSSCATSNNNMREGLETVRGGGGGDGSNGRNEMMGAAAFATSSSSILRRLWRRPPLASSSSLGGLATTASSSIDDSYSYQGEQLQSLHQPLIPRTDEPNLYNLPTELYPTYRPMPLILRLVLPIVSAVIVATRYRYSLPMRWSDILSPLNSRRVLLSPPVIRYTLSFLLRSVLLWTIATLSIQENYFPPSQITTTSLAQAGQLPSTLSRYSIVTPLPEVVDRGAVVQTPVIPIGVHSIRYTKRGKTGVTTDNESTFKNYDGISFHHGFGASSLSWLPALPSIVERLGSNKGRHSPAAVGVAHDAPGFGFTDRPDGDVDGGLRQYSSENSANIGLALLVESLSEQQQQDQDEDSVAAIMKDAKSIAIFGHSMGARAALLMAHHCATDPTLKLRPNLIVLVAPALEGVTLPSVKRVGYHVKVSRRQSPTWSMAGRVWLLWRKVFVDKPLQYGLRRLVCGTKDFWRNGLMLAWGDPHRLSDSDVLRFQWPSVGRGWEGGILNFARSRILSSPHPGTLDDVRLLRDVTNHKDTRVVIVHGSRDGIVRIDSKVAERVCKDFPNIKFIRMEECGHDPFEEDVQGFVTALEKSIECE